MQAAFESVFPISSHNGFARLDFVEYALGESMFDVRECQQRGLTLRHLFELRLDWSLWIERQRSQLLKK